MDISTLTAKADPSITSAKLRQLAPAAPWSTISLLAPRLDAEARTHAISTPRRVRHWLAQLATESGGFARLEENLNYSPERLMVVWPKRFPTLASAQPYAHNAKALASKVYNGRMGNRAGTSDGYDFRGSGLIMRTGRDGFDEASKEAKVDFVGRPDLLRTEQYAALDAAAFWQAHGCNEIADADDGERCYATVRAGVLGNEIDDLRQETETVNGGLTGLADRQAWLLKAAAIWPDVG